MTIQLLHDMTNSYGHLLNGRDAFKLMRVVGGGEREMRESYVDKVMIIMATPQLKQRKVFTSVSTLETAQLSHVHHSNCLLTHRVTSQSSSLLALPVTSLVQC